MPDKPIEPTEHFYSLNELIDSSNLAMKAGYGNESRARKLNHLANWIDTIHSRKFADPDTLKALIQDQSIESILNEHLVEWPDLIQKLEQLIQKKNKKMILLFQKMRGWLKPVLFYYIIFTASILWFGKVPINWPPMTFVSSLVLIFLVAVYGYRFYFERNWFGPQLDAIIKGLALDDNLKRTVQDLIFLMHREILENRLNPLHFNLVFGNGDYKGMIWTVKPNLTTSDTFEGHPYPLYSVITKAKKNLKIVLPRFDPVLLSTLKEVNPDVYIRLLVSEGIVRVRRFSIYYNFLTIKKKIKLLVKSTALRNTGNRLLIITDDEVWNEESETRGITVKRAYFKITEEAQIKSMNGLFNRFWDSGARFEVPTPADRRKSKK